MAINSYHTSITADEITDPLVIEFMHSVGEENFLDFEVLTQRDFMKFWPHIVINRFEDNDFTYVFFGTTLVKIFGKDRTGLKISELGNPFRKKDLTDALHKVIKTHKVVYGFGDLKVDDREHLKWQQVKLPLRRKGEINEVLTLISFSPLS
jgi:hypothetical protein